MSTPKGNKKGTSQWSLCDKCSTTILNKDGENHADFCPPNLNDIKHTFVQNGLLCGKIESKLNEEIKNLSFPLNSYSSRDKDNLVFVSQHAMQLCSFAIGENVLVEVKSSKYREQENNSRSVFLQKIWPTNEKALTSVLFTKNCVEQLGLNIATYVTVKKINLENTSVAQKVNLILINGPKSLQITPEISNRISKCYVGLYLIEGNMVNVMFYGNLLKFEIKTIESEKKINQSLEFQLKNVHIGDDLERKIYLIKGETRWTFFGDKELFYEEQKYLSLIEIVGLENELLEIESIMQATLETSNSLNISSKAVLLHGNSGTGKTAFVENIARQSGKYVVKMTASDLYNNKNGRSPEDIITELFNESMENAPSILIIDEIDVLCPTRSSRLTDSEKRITSAMMNCLDGLNKRSCGVFILATTNRIDGIDMAFRRYGRLDKEIEIPTPTPKTRKVILQHLLKNLKSYMTDENLQEIAMATHGFVGADLRSLCSQANLNSLKRGSNTVEFEDFKIALRKVRPSAMKEVQIEVPNVKWSDIGGQENLKLILRQAVEWPLKYPESFLRLGISPPKGVLMFGPPGCSKTMIAKALANESGLNFLSIKGPELFSKWVGDSEKAIRDVFRKARQVAPSIIFFDEIDALGGERTSGSSASVQERVLAQLLTELDGVTPLGDVTILAATNRPDKIDKALLRPGRLDRIVYVPLPDEHTRREIFRIKLSKMPVTDDVTIDDLVQKSLGYSGAEVNAVCHEAAMMALEEDIQTEKVEIRHFEKALGLVTPRTSKSLLDLYTNYVNSKYNPEA